MRKKILTYKLIVLTIVSVIMISSSAFADIDLIKNGQSRYKIVVPNKQTKVIDYSANEMQYFLRKVSGVTLPIETENEAGDCPAILIGESGRVKNMGLSKKVDALGDDGVFIKSVGKDIVLLGKNGRGQLYSVYSFLENYFGVRFLAIDCTVIPKQRIVTLPDINYSYTPQFMYREILIHDAFPKVIAARQRLNGPFSECDDTVGGKILFYPWCHSSNLLVPPDKYYKDHPEYFGLVNGKRTTGPVDAQLCLTNPDVLKIATKQVFDWIKEHPDATSIDVSQNDGGNPCQCDKCQAVVKEEGSEHGPIMRFVNAIADAVAKKYPNMYIDTLAYSYSTKPSAITMPHKNVIIRLCHTGCYFHGFENDPLGAGFADNIAGWTKICKHVFVWHYAINFAHYLCPNPNLNGLVKDIRYYNSHRLNGLMIHSSQQCSGAELSDLRQYLCSQLLWDPSRDPMKIRKEFCDGYYGSASNDVMEFLALMDKLGENPNVHAYGNWNPCDTVTPEFVAQGLTILNRARAGVKDKKIANHIDKLLMPLWYMQLSWSDKYGLSSSDAPALLGRFEQVASVNKITSINESPQSMPAWLSGMKDRYTPLPKGVVFSLFKSYDKAVTDNCADWRKSGVEKDGKTLNSIFMHPKPEGLAKAAYDISLPTVKNSEKILFKFATALTAQSANGVRFGVLVDGNEVWNTVLQADKNDISKSFLQNSIDLSGYAGKKIKLTLSVDALGDTSNDWANWVEPQIIVQNN